MSNYLNKHYFPFLPSYCKRCDCNGNNILQSKIFIENKYNWNNICSCSDLNLIHKCLDWKLIHKFPKLVCYCDLNTNRLMPTCLSVDRNLSNWGTNDRIFWNVQRKTVRRSPNIFSDVSRLHIVPLAILEALRILKFSFYFGLKFLWSYCRGSGPW